MGCKILKQISLVEYSATGKTKHYRGNIELPRPFFLQIAKYDDDSGFYLFYLNENMEELTDTYHKTIEKAYDQANWEFGIEAKDWNEVNSQ